MTRRGRCPGRGRRVRCSHERVLLDAAGMLGGGGGAGVLRAAVRPGSDLSGVGGAVVWGGVLVGVAGAGPGAFGGAPPLIIRCGGTPASSNGTIIRSGLSIHAGAWIRLPDARRSFACAARVACRSSLRGPACTHRWGG